LLIPGHQPIKRFELPAADQLAFGGLGDVIVGQSRFSPR
jgi:hypothetical protein